MASQSFESNSPGFKFWLCGLLFFPLQSTAPENVDSYSSEQDPVRKKSVMKRGINAARKKDKRVLVGLGKVLIQQTQNPGLSFQVVFHAQSH